MCRTTPLHAVQEQLGDTAIEARPRFILRCICGASGLCRRALGLNYLAIFVEAELPDDHRHRLDTVDIDVLRRFAPAPI